MDSDNCGNDVADPCQTLLWLFSLIRNETNLQMLNIFTDKSLKIDHDLQVCAFIKLHFSLIHRLYIFLCKSFTWNKIT